MAEQTPRPRDEKVAHPHQLPSARSTVRRWGPAFLGVAALAGTLIAYWVRDDRRERWVHTVLVERCRTLPPLPDVRVETWIGIVLCAFAVGCFLRFEFLVGCDKPRDLWLPVTVGGALTLVAVIGLLVGVIFVTTTGTDPYGGLDGSGVPCGSG